MEPQGDSGWIRWGILGLGLSVVWVAYMALFGPTVDSLDRLAVPGLVGTGSKQPVDWTWTVLDLNDKPVPFAQFQGKTIVLNLWATWCQPCRREMPSLAALAANAEIQAKGVEVVCMATDESSEPVRQYLARKPWPMTFLRATGLPSAFLSDGIPATFVIAPDGRIAATELGPARWDDPAVIEFLKQLAASKP